MTVCRFKRGLGKKEGGGQIPLPDFGHPTLKSQIYMHGYKPGEHGRNMLKSLTLGGEEKFVDMFMKNQNKIFSKTILKTNVLISICNDF